MANTASQSLDVRTTSSSGDAVEKAKLIEYVLKRQASDDSDTIDADVSRYEDRQSNTLVALQDEACGANQVFPLPLPKEARRRPSLVQLQEWEGYVLDVSETGFTARLVDLTRQETTPSEEADFDVEEVSDNDRDLLREGAVFRWTIGYETAPGGTKKRVSQLFFRRLPKWTKNEIAQADARAQDLLAGIRWE